MNANSPQQPEEPTSTVRALHEVAPHEVMARTGRRGHGPGRPGWAARPGSRPVGPRRASSQVRASPCTGGSPTC